MCHDPALNDTRGPAEGSEADWMEGLSEKKRELLAESLEPIAQLEKKLNGVYGCEAHIGDWLALTIVGMTFLIVSAILAWIGYRYSRLIWQSVRRLLRGHRKSVLHELVWVSIFSTFSAACLYGLLGHIDPDDQWYTTLFPYLCVLVVALILLQRLIWHLHIKNPDTERRK